MLKDIISTTSSHPHPVIYLRGFRDTDLNSIIDFMYCGEANVLESDVERFLDSAKDLKVDNVIDLYYMLLRINLGSIFCSKINRYIPIFLTQIYFCIPEIFKTNV